MPSRTAQETNTFERQLHDLDAAVQKLDLIPTLDAVARLAVTFGARLRFVRILGHRWSYVAGCSSQTPAGRFMEGIPLGDGHFGLVSEGWGRLSGTERQRLIAFVSERIAAEELP